MGLDIILGDEQPGSCPRQRLLGGHRRRPGRSRFILVCSRCWGCGLQAVGRAPLDGNKVEEGRKGFFRAGRTGPVRGAVTAEAPGAAELAAQEPSK